MILHRFIKMWNTVSVTRPHLHVVVHNLQEAVVFIVVQRGGEGGTSQEHGGVMEVKLLDRSRRRKLEGRKEKKRSQHFSGSRSTVCALR